jgi:hypothetical protein
MPSWLYYRCKFLWCFHARCALPYIGLFHGCNPYGQGSSTGRCRELPPVPVTGMAVESTAWPVLYTAVGEPSSPPTGWHGRNGYTAVSGNSLVVFNMNVIRDSLMKGIENVIRARIWASKVVFHYPQPCKTEVPCAIAQEWVDRSFRFYGYL